MKEAASWKLTGEHQELINEYMEERKNERGKYLPRVIVPDGETRVVCFAPGDPVVYEDHSVQEVRAGYTRYNAYTCSRGDCELCGRGVAKVRRAAYKVVNMTPYTRQKDGKTFVNSPQVLVLSSTAWQVLLDEIKDNGLEDPALAVFKVRRRGNGAQTTYSFKLVEKRAKKKIRLIAKKMVKEMDLMSLLAPPDKKKQKMLAKRYEEMEDDERGGKSKSREEEE